MTNTNALQFREENSCRKYTIGEGITAVLLLRMEGVLHHTAADTVWPGPWALGEASDRALFFPWMKFLSVRWNFLFIMQHHFLFMLLLLSNHPFLMWLCLKRLFPGSKIIGAHGSVHRQLCPVLLNIGSQLQRPCQDSCF